MLKKY